MTDQEWLKRIQEQVDDILDRIYELEKKNKEAYRIINDMDTIMKCEEEK